MALIMGCSLSHQEPEPFLRVFPTSPELLPSMDMYSSDPPAGLKPTAAEMAAAHRAIPLRCTNKNAKSVSEPVPVPPQNPNTGFAPMLTGHPGLDMFLGMLGGNFQAPQPSAANLQVFAKKAKPLADVDRKNDSPMTPKQFALTNGSPEPTGNQPVPPQPAQPPLFNTQAPNAADVEKAKQEAQVVEDALHNRDSWTIQADSTRSFSHK